jgi:hypothetical protein
MAQWSVPGPVLLEGPSQAERQIIGLPPPIAADHALALGELRSQMANDASLLVNGDVWELTLPSLPDPVLPGTVIRFIVPSTTPSLGVSISVNAATPLPLVGWNGAPLNGYALLPGSALRVVRGGGTYQVLDALHRSCPVGLLPYATAACIDPLPRPAASFYQAADSCVQIGARLCTMGEWVAACAIVPGFMEQVSQAEWVDHAANSADRAKVIGVGENGYSGAGTGCDYGGHRSPSNFLPYRCCVER